MFSTTKWTAATTLSWRAACAALLAVGIVSSAGAQQTGRQSRATSTQQPLGPEPANLDRNGTLILIRTTLLALDQANTTGNYTVLRDLSAPGFRDANTAAKLSQIFVQQRETNLDLSGVAVLDPQLTLLPQIETSGLLHMAGFFPSVPTQVNFELLFAPVEGRWRPFGIAVNLGSSSPVAPIPDAALTQAPPSVSADAMKKPTQKALKAKPKSTVSKKP